MSRHSFRQPTSSLATRRKLAEALAHCGECHTPRNLAFAPDNRKKFGGAVTAGWQMTASDVADLRKQTSD